MAKRFTDTDKWKKPFLRGMEAPYKLLWFYILDDCDHAGVWQVDEEVASIRVGANLDFNKAINLFKNHIQIIDNGNKWFIPDFIEFQYGELNPVNRVHLSIIQIHKRYKIKPLTSPLQGAKDKDKDKDMDKDKDKGEKSEFQISIDNFVEMRKKMKKPITDEGMKLMRGKLEQLAPNDEKKQIAILNQSIMNSWLGLFELKTPTQQNIEIKKGGTDLRNVNVDEIDYTK